VSKLAEYFHKLYYPDMSLDDIIARIDSDENIFNKAVDIVQKNHYSDVPLENFRGIIGNIFKPKIKQATEQNIQTIDSKPVEPFEVSQGLQIKMPDKFELPIFNNQQPIINKVPKFNNIVEKQKYYDSLVDKYGEGVKGRQNYIDLYNQKLNIPETSFPAFDIDSPKHLLPKKYQSLSDDEMKDYLYEIGQFSKEAPRIKGFPAKNDTWKDIIERNKNINNKALLFSSLMDEGGDQTSSDLKEGANNDEFMRNLMREFDGYASFGLDTAGNRVEELIKTGLLDKNILAKNRTRLKTATNEKGQNIITMGFSNLDDVVSVKNAFIENEKRNIVDFADSKSIFLSPKAIDYFTIAAINYGPNGAKKMVEDYYNSKILDNDEFMNTKLQKYQQIDKNIKRRLAAARMLTEEGVIK
jgi:hypothetical protein